MSLCRFCYHKDRERIDRLYVVGTPMRIICHTYGGSLAGASRHRKHVAQLVKERLPAEREKTGSNLIARVDRLVAEAEGILTTAKATGQLKTAVNAIQAAAKCLSILGHLTGELVAMNAPTYHLSVNRITNISSNTPEDQHEMLVMAFEALEACATSTGFDAEQVDQLRKLIEIGEQMSKRASRNPPDVPLQLTAKTEDIDATSTSVPEDAAVNPEPEGEE